MNQDPLCHPRYNPRMTLCSLSSIIHVYYRHLLIILHVNDCVTTSFAIGFAAPLVPFTAISPFMVYSSIIHSPS
jgi:hypothetical protein